MSDSKNQENHELGKLDDLDLQGVDLGLEEPFDVSSEQVGVLNKENTQPTGPSMQILNSIPVNMTIEVSSKTVLAKELLSYEQGSVIILDKVVGQPVDIKVNGVLFGTGQIVDANGVYGVRLLNLANTDQ